MPLFARNFVPSLVANFQSLQVTASRCSCVCVLDYKTFRYIRIHRAEQFLCLYSRSPNLFSFKELEKLAATVLSAAW